MTSVLNRPLPLNGSKMIISFLIPLFLIACSTGKEITRTKNPKVISTTPAKVKEANEEVLAMDTIRWTVEPTEEMSPIVSESGSEPLFGEVKKSEYNIALLLPFRLNGNVNEELDANNMKFAHFYSSLKLALEQSKYDLNVKIKTYETNRNSNEKYD